MPSQKYYGLLIGQIVLILALSLSMPFVAWGWIKSPHIYNLSEAIFEIVFSIGYGILVFPFLVLSLFLAWKLYAYSRSGNIEKTEAVRHLIGGFIAFIPYYLFDLKSLIGMNASQGPGDMLISFTAPLIMWVLYKIGYLLCEKYSRG